MPVHKMTLDWLGRGLQGALEALSAPELCLLADSINTGMSCEQMADSNGCKRSDADRATDRQDILVDLVDSFITFVASS